MGIRKTGHVFIFHSEIRQVFQHLRRFLQNDFGSLPQDNDVCIIPYITACCAQMDDGFCRRTLFPKSIYMAHNVMANDTFSFFRHFVIDVVFESLHLCNLFICNIQPQCFFRPRQSNPKSAPCAKFELFRKYFLHFLAGITGRKR